MATAPIYWQTMHEEAGVRITTANANTDGVTGAYGVVATGHANGTHIKGVRLSAPGTTAEDKVRLFKKVGSFAIMVAEVYVTPIPVGLNVDAFKRWISLDLQLEDASYTLIASTHNGGDFDLYPEGKDKGA